ncbi:MAG: hypothetical protein KC776_05685 [Myxococcales bacterium]|nr:hypothetical protein [Myxococcales bacterium]MCB9583040.1 quinol:cytochrome C oxidoreductase [Polyangiaceae bacterium]
MASDDKKPKKGDEPKKKKPAQPEDDFGDNIKLGDAADKIFKIGGGVGAVSLLVCLGLGFTGDTKRFLFSYLTAYMWVLSLGLGALWWVILQHLVNAKWSIVIRRVGELLAQNVVVLLLLALPIVIPMAMGNDSLYIWVNHEKVHADHLLHHKAPYLNVGFFMARCAVYFGFWFLLSRFMLKSSLEQDKTGKPELVGRMQAVSAPSMILFALTLTFAAFDFLMSLEPTWFSTIFGVYYFAGAVVSFHSLLALVLMWLQKRGRLTRSVTVEHYHDVGKMMFAFTIFWAYIAFSQFMLIWYGNIPEETFWFKMRFAGEWKYVSTALLLGNFVLPFFGLLSRHIKRNKKTLGFWAVWILLVHYMDIYWLVKPALHEPTIPVGDALLDVTALVGVLGLFLASAAFQAKKVRLVPVKDPRLAKSLAFENF